MAGFILIMINVSSHNEHGVIYLYVDEKRIYENERELILFLHYPFTNYDDQHESSM